MRSFCVPAILGSYVILFVEAFLTPGVFRPPYPSKGKIAEAICLLLSGGFIAYVMLKRIYEAPKKNYSKRGYHSLLLLNAYAGLLFLVNDEAFGFNKIPLRVAVGVYFIYGVYITAGIHINHVSLV